jgi:hypothetical protein
MSGQHRPGTGGYPSHVQRAGAPHPSPAPGSVQRRDLDDAELSEAMDADAERAAELLHADTRWCPRCRQPTLTRPRDRTCMFCDAMTAPHETTAT